MKKFLGFILVVLLVLSSGQFVSAQTIESSSWGFRFLMSDNWNCSISNDTNIYFVHKYTSGESLSISRQQGYGNYTIRTSQSILDPFLDGFFSNSSLSKQLTKANNGEKISVSEVYQKRNFETYNGIEYYRAQKLFKASAEGYSADYFYRTSIYTVQNGYLYSFFYSARGDDAPHFSDVIDMLNTLRFADANGSLYKIGDIIDYALKTDIIATINGHQIPSFNVNGHTYIVAEDLKHYGFRVNYDDPTRALAIDRDTSQTAVSRTYYKPAIEPQQVGEREHAILFTDIKTYLDGNYTASCNINGQTIIRFDSLKAYGGVSYDDSKREISLSLPGIN